MSNDVLTTKNGGIYNMDSGSITASPTNGLDIANKNYVDSKDLTVTTTTYNGNHTFANGETVGYTINFYKYGRIVHLHFYAIMTTSVSTAGARELLLTVPGNIAPINTSYAIANTTLSENVFKNIVINSAGQLYIATTPNGRNGLGLGATLTYISKE